MKKSIATDILIKRCAELETIEIAAQKRLQEYGRDDPRWAINCDNRNDCFAIRMELEELLSQISRRIQEDK